MARLEGTDKRYFEIIPHPEVKGENVLALMVSSISVGGDVLYKYWTYAEVEEALDPYGVEEVKQIRRDAELE